VANFQRWKGIQKCYPFEEKRLAKWEPPYIVQPKYDGVRCRAIPLHNGNYLLLSSEENPIFSVPHINEACKSQLDGREYDGELYCHGMSFEEIISITSRTTNIHPDHEAIQFHIFDVVTDEIQAIRIKDLNDKDMKSPLIKTPYWIAYNLDDIMRIYNELISLGYEGIIVRHIQSIYERKRSLWVMKFKPKKEDIYAILDKVEEVSINGVPKGRLGALILDSGDGNTFSVGSGFSDSDRYDLWMADLTGKYVKVQYQHLTSGKKVPRFPVFMEVIENG
jgi:DNA ligase-1